MEEREQILLRMYAMLTVLCVIPLLVGVQIVRINLQDGSGLREQGERQASSFQPIPAGRGAILDRSGRVLAVNIARYELAVDPTAPGFDEASGWFFDKLSALTRRPASGYRSRVRNRASTQYVLLERGLAAAHVERVSEWDIPGLIIEPRFARRYNHARTGSHMIGHVNTDLTGISGVELQYDRYLSGKPGRRAVKRDRRGYIKPFVGGAVIQPQHGETIVLTIDLIRQTIMEEELERGVRESGATWGTAIAMDPYTGAILAMANHPTYDPNNPAAYLESARRNRAVADRIEPGSTFKLITAIAAVEQGTIALDDTVDTGQGWAVFRGRTMRDVHAHGRIPFREVISKSSNVGVAKTAVRLDPGVMYQYARNLGFGQLTWIDVPGEVAGSLKKPSEWSGVTQPWMSIGYEIEATPLQLLTAYAALANGGLLVQPFVLAERRDMTGRTTWTARQDSIRRAFQPETAARLMTAFEETVMSGTGTHAKVEGLRIAGKTGTAQKAVGGSYDRRSHRASFAGIFPVEEPTVAMIVILDEPRSSAYGGAVAAPIFQRIARRWAGTFPNIVNLMAPVEPLPDTSYTTVPNVAGMPFYVATTALQSAGLRAVTRRKEGHSGQKVVAQYPAPGEAVTIGSPVRIHVAEVPADSARLMPDLTGLGSRQAVTWLASLGMEVELRGQGTVVSQSPRAGSSIVPRAVLTCR